MYTYRTTGIVCFVYLIGNLRGGRGVRGIDINIWGGTHILILHLLAFPFLRQSTFFIACIALTQTKRLRKEIKYILIHNNTLQSFAWSSIALNIHVSHFENWLFSFMVSLQKWLMHFNYFRNDADMKIARYIRHLILGMYSIQV